MNIYEYFFRKENDWKDLDHFLRKRMSELVTLRNHLIFDSYISEYESKYVVPDMKNSNPTGAYIDPSPDYVYGCQLREVMTILRVMDYKSCCFMRNLNRLKEEVALAPAINTAIREHIMRNPGATYDEIIKLDEKLDIATEFEHMIEVQEIVSEPKKKKESMKDSFVWADYPKERWRILP